MDELFKPLKMESLMYHLDASFDSIYPQKMAELSSRHWTPLSIAREAIRFLSVEPKGRILDIGSGAGKFCLAAAHFAPEAHMYGIEHRRELVEYAEKARLRLKLNNVVFLHGNFSELDFDQFDHFYFFNSFYENLDSAEKIDKAVPHSVDLYHYYHRRLYKMLAGRPSGTRLVTYYSQEEEIPQDFMEVGSKGNNLLKFWIKS